MNIQNHFDFTSQGRKPSTPQIIAAWKKAGRPDSFSVAYGETEAEFARWGSRWGDTGNGCSGVKRGAVVTALTKESGPVTAKNWLG